MTESIREKMYDKVVKEKLEGELCERWEKIEGLRKKKRKSWGEVVEWLKRDGVDERLSEKRLMSFCRRQGRVNGRVEGWAGKSRSRRKELRVEQGEKIVSFPMEVVRERSVERGGKVDRNWNPPMVAPSVIEEGEIVEGKWVGEMGKKDKDNGVPSGDKKVGDIGVTKAVEPGVEKGEENKVVDEPKLGIEGVNKDEGKVEVKVGRIMTAERAREIKERALAEEAEALRKKEQSDRDWDLEGSSGEGMLTLEEIARKRAWEAEQERLKGK